MKTLLLFIAIVIFVCIAFQKLGGKLGVPGLFVFILLGMLFGSDGIFKIPFEDYSFANSICSIALIYIMFYGGVGTKWSTAKPVAVKAILLSSLGTVLTAGLVGLFCYFALGFELLESFLMGSVICSTDAASVFSILRSKKMDLRFSTAPMLEVESGSNDPFSYMLTVIILSLMRGEGSSVWSIIWMLALQVVVGVVCGFLFALLSRFILDKVDLTESGFDTAFLVAIAAISYAVPELLGGNGYLSVYITGIVIGNSKMPNKKAVVNFFDGVTILMQMCLFFLLGLLAFPSHLPAIAGIALLIALFLTFVARPIAVAAVLTPFKCKWNQQLFVSWSGMRGAASIVFAIMAVTDPAAFNYDIFHIVFFIVLYSILIQGTLLPFVARLLKMIDENGDVMKTFTDYADEVPIQFIKFDLKEGHAWENKLLCEIVLPPDCLLVLIIRDGQKIIPRGSTQLLAGDTVILSGKEGGKVKGVNLYEKEIIPDDEWANKFIFQLNSDEKFIVLIKRQGSIIIPNGDTELCVGDILVINDPSQFTLA